MKFSLGAIYANKRGAPPYRVLGSHRFALLA